MRNERKAAVGDLHVADEVDTVERAVKAFERITPNASVL
jgi:hypothetical protein